MLRRTTVQIPANVFENGDTYADVRTRILEGGGVMEEMLRASEAGLAKEKIDVAPFTRLPAPVRVLILSEDWCGDCTDNLPVIDRIARESGKLDVRIVSRDANLEIADAHLKYGKFRSVPLMLFLNPDGSVAGELIERPESVTELRARKRREIYETHPEFGTPETSATLPEETRAALSAALMEMRAETRPFAIQEVGRELGEIASRIAAEK
jgi:hypothetical protein